MATIYGDQNPADPNDSLEGTDGEDSIYGLTGSDPIKGGVGADWIDGGEGTDQLDGGVDLDVDTLTGGADRDSFVFEGPLRSRDADIVTDFTSGEDKFRLDGDVFVNLNIGPLAKDAFVLGTKAQDVEDRIVYDAETGRLWFDLDGSGRGAAVKIATLEDGVDVSHKDFVVF